MPRRCSICHHERLEEINRALVEGAALSEMAAKYRVSDDALSRHKANHLPDALVKAQEAKEAEPSPGPRPSCCARNAQYAGALLYPRTDGGCCR
jgi:hypothetical protein